MDRQVLCEQPRWQAGVVGTASPTGKCCGNYLTDRQVLWELSQ
jgi:hypothetical protein